MVAKVEHASLPPWGNALAGATGAVLANAAIYPLDIVKTRLQVQINSKPTNLALSTQSEDHYTSTLDALKKIVEESGITGLYAGICGSLIGVASTNFAYFYWYSVARSLYLSSLATSKTLGTVEELSLGATAGAIAQIFTIPVSVITTRQQTQKKGEPKGLFDTGREVVRSEDGWSGLWRGLRASLVLVINPAITYGVYQRFRDYLFDDHKKLRPVETFALGALSKVLATVVSQPLIVAKVSLQSRPPLARQGRPFKSLLEVLSYIIDHEGPLGLFKGIGPQITKGILVQGLLMMMKERLEIIFLILLVYYRRLRSAKLQRAAEIVFTRAKRVLPAIAK